MILRVLCVISVAILGWSETVAQQKWTLHQCIDYAMEHNLQIQQSQNSLQSAEVDVKQAKSQLFPSLTFSSQQQLGFQKVETQNSVRMTRKQRIRATMGRMAFRET